MMKVPLITCVLLTFISLGVSLDCEVCSGPGYNCSGSTITCPMEDNSCGTTALEVFGERIVNKGCVPSNICSLGISTVNFGKTGFQRSAVSCCAENGCNKNGFEVPERNTTANGKTCPACYAVQNDCVEETIQCVGDEVNCFTMSTSESDGTVKTSVTVKGCANNDACASLKHGETLLGEMSSIHVSHTVTCTSSNISGLWGLLFPCLSGLLFMRFLA